MGHRPKTINILKGNIGEKYLLSKDFFVLGKDLDMMSETQYIKEKKN